MSDSPIRILVVDDQEMVRAGFRLLLDQPEDLVVVGEAEDGRAALAVARDLRPDVVLMDIRMPHLDGIATTRELLTSLPDTRVIVLTTFDVDDYVYGALRAGASGFLLKSAPPETLVRAIRTVASGEALLDPAVTRRVIERFGSLPEEGHRQAPEFDRLTEREREVLGLMARGLSNSEIAGSLVVSEATVKTHVARVLAKLQVRDRVQAVVYTYENGISRPGLP